MNRILMCALAVLLLVSFGYAQTQSAPAQDQSALKTDKDKQSYSIGMNIGSSFKAQSIDVNLDLLVRGIQDAMKGSKPLMSDEEMRATLTALQGQMAAKQAAMQEKAASDNKTKGDAFLAANKAKEGVVTLPSGLQYKILKQGTGAKPTENDTVTTHYKGTLIDGTVFDSSYDRKEPATFPVNGVIKGWTEALQLMTVGSKWQLVIPPDLAYGERGAGGVIGPNETLVFEVELLSIGQPQTSTK